MSQDTTKISIFFKEFSVLATEFSEVTHRLNKPHVEGEVVSNKGS